MNSQQNNILFFQTTEFRSFNEALSTCERIFYACSGVVMSRDKNGLLFSLRDSNIFPITYAIGFESWAFCPDPTLFPTSVPTYTVTSTPTVPTFSPSSKPSLQTREIFVCSSYEKFDETFMPARCEFDVKAGETIVISDCKSLGCDGNSNDQFIELTNSVGYLTHNDDFCGKCSQITYTALLTETLTLIESCRNKACSGKFTVSDLIYQTLRMFCTGVFKIRFIPCCVKVRIAFVLSIF
jgi:hypothetical protein